MSHSDEKYKHIEQIIKTYFEGCNEANFDKMVACFLPSAIHYFPPDMYDGPWRGADTIANHWIAAVEKLGSYWTIDNIVVDINKNEAVIEWTHFKTKLGGYLRGDEWYRFDKDGLICEIKAYYACPTVDGGARYEIGGFDYKALGYPLTAPQEAFDPARGSGH